VTQSTSDHDAAGDRGQPRAAGDRAPSTSAGDGNGHSSRQAILSAAAELFAVHGYN